MQVSNLIPNNKIALLTILFIILSGYCNAIDYPAADKPGIAETLDYDDSIILKNNILLLKLSVKNGNLRLLYFADKDLVNSTRAGELFEVELAGGQTIKCSEMKIVGKIAKTTVTANPNARKLAERFAGVQLQATLVSADGRLQADWKMVLRDESNYVRQIAELKSIHDSVTVESIAFNKLLVKDAHTEGTVSGSPVISNTMFFAYEHPNSNNYVFDPAAPVNYALNRTVSASGVFQSLRPELAVDGNYNVSQHWGCQDTPVWLMVDLESHRTIEDIRLVTYYNNKRYYGYTIELSDDGEKWKKFVDASDNKTPATAKGYLHKANGVKARHIRVTITNNSEGAFYGGHIVEVEVPGKSDFTTEIKDKHIVCELDRSTELAKGNSLIQSAVLGVVPKDQLRRGFLYYIERERVSPYKPFLHYNSWYDIAFPSRDKMNAKECVDVINGFGKELVTKRNVPIDSFVFDDGWDDPKTLWRILKENFPDGWVPLHEASKSFNSKLGVWLSPWGGYGQTKQDRIDHGKTQGFETGKAGFSLVGENYFKRFRQSCLDFVNDYDVNFFKFDGTDASLLNETEALFKLTGELYDTGKVDFISLTTGTWASPFWLLHGDSIWRGGHDMSFAGKGSKRQQWITYRDAETYEKVVCKGPLYPLNSFMNQGIAHAKWGTAVLSANAVEFAEEVYSFFGVGTNLQELYISHDLMTDEMWDILAEGAKWSRANSHILVDSHWIGGDPVKLEVYGCASWQDDQGVIMLRNPDDKPREIGIDIAKAFHLPYGAAKNYSLKSPWKADASKPAITLMSGKKHTFKLQPFEVIVLEGKGL